MSNASPAAKKARLRAPDSLLDDSLLDVAPDSDKPRRARPHKFQDFVAAQQAVVAEHVGALLATLDVATLMRTAHDLNNAGKATFKLWAGSGERMGAALDALEAKREAAKAAATAKLAASRAALAAEGNRLSAAERGKRRVKLYKAHVVALRDALLALDASADSPHLPTLPLGVALYDLEAWGTCQRPPASHGDEIHLPKTSNEGGNSVRCYRYSREKWLACARVRGRVTPADRARIWARRRAALQAEGARDPKFYTPYSDEDAAKKEFREACASNVKERIRDALRRPESVTDIDAHIGAGGAAAHYAAAYNLTTTLRFLLLTCGADPEALFKNSWTPLHFACTQPTTGDAVRVLVEESGANDVAITAGGKDPLLLAATAKPLRADAAVLLLRHGVLRRFDLGDADTAHIRVCFSLDRICRSSNRARAAVAAVPGMVDVVVECLRRHQEKKANTLQALRTLGALAYICRPTFAYLGSFGPAFTLRVDAAVQEAVGAIDGIFDLIAGALRRFPAVTEVQLHGCEAFAALAHQHSVNAARIRGNIGVASELRLAWLRAEERESPAALYAELALAAAQINKPKNIYKDGTH